MRNKLLIMVSLVLGLLAACRKDNDTPLRADFSATRTELLAGDTVFFSDLSDGQPSSWKWEFEGGNPATSNLSGPRVIYTEPGTYAVSLEVTNKQTSSVERRTEFITVGYRAVSTDFTYSATTIRQNDSVQFTDASTGMPTTWAWEFTSGATTITSAEKNPKIEFTVPGVYTVKLTASNPLGPDTETKTDIITVIDITSVEAEFDSEQAATYAGGEVKFFDQSIGTATSWAWTFEGASVTTSTEQNPTATYPTAGRYRVTLVASNPSRSSTMTKEAYVLVVPGADLTAFYPLNNSLHDAGPSKLQSQGQGSITFATPDRNNAAGRSGTFSSTTGIFVPDNDAMNFGTGNYTVSVWVKTNTNQRGMIWQESGAAGSGDNQTWVRILGSATNLTSFSTEDQSGGSTINLTTANAGAAATTNDGVWHHIVTVRNGALTQLYIDGVRIREATSATGVKTTSNAAGFKIGMQETATGWSNRFIGQIDDLIIYKRALTEAEVIALKNL